MDLEYVVSHWESVRAGLIATIAKFSDEELAFKPFATSWTAREIMLHIAQEEHGELSYGITQTLLEFPMEYATSDYPTRAAIEVLLGSVHAVTLDYLKTLDEAGLGSIIATPWGANHRLIEMLGHLIEHEIHHRAELSLILGMLGHEGLSA